METNESRIETKNADSQKIDDGFNPSTQRDNWEQVGFHRSLGGFLHNIVIGIASTVVGLLFIGFLTGLLYPFPEIQGYNKVANGFFFIIIYQIFDFGTAFGIQRFIAEYRIKDPKRMIQYVQFFIWYQMLTGLIQVTVISLVVIYIIRTSEYAYLTWLFLIICQKQWPGMLGTFGAVLEGMQLYNRTNILKFITSDVIQNITNVTFILLGRYLGAQNPMIGELMGAAMGTALGMYVDDFFAMAIGMKYLGKVLQPFGLRVRDLWELGFDKKVAKDCLWFGFQVSIVPIFDSIIGVNILFLYLKGLPQYTSYVAIRDIASGVVGIVNLGTYGTTPLIAESYMNKKTKLASFYITSSIRWNGFLMWMMVAILIAFLPMVFQIILELPELSNYISAQAFIIPLLIHQLFRPFIDFPNGILIGTERVSFFTFIRVSEEILQLFFVWLFLFGVQLQIIWGFFGVVFILSFEHFFPRIIKMIACWVYIKKKLFPIKINWWQTLIGPLFVSFFVYLFGVLYYNTVFKSLLPIIGILPTAAFSLLFGLTMIPFLIYMPLTGFFGLWDDFNIKTFEKAVAISGPSKFLANLFYKSAKWGISHSPWHNKFKTPWEEAEKEIDELMKLKETAEYKSFEKSIADAPWLKTKKK